MTFFFFFDDLKVPTFFLAPNPFTYRSYFLLDKRFGNKIQIKIFLFETFILLVALILHSLS